MFMTQAWQCHLTRAAAAVRGKQRAACSVPDHDAVFVSLEPRRAGLLFAAVIHGRLRPPVAESETPVGIRQSAIRARARAKAYLLANPKRRRYLIPSCRSISFSKASGRRKESVGPMRLREGVSHSCSCGAVEAWHGCQQQCVLGQPCLPRPP